MPKGKVVVIGAGLSGLAAGCYARMNEHPTVILEQQGKPGGGAATWSQNGFLIDPGPHLIWGHGPGTATYDLYRELGVLPQRRVMPLKAWVLIDEKGGHRLDLTSPPEKLEEEMKRISPQDTDAIEDLIDAIMAIEPCTVMDLSASRPTDMVGPVSRLHSLWKTRKYLSYLRGRWDRPLSQLSLEFHDPFLQRLVTSLCLPEAPAWLGVTMLSLASNGALGQLEGGSDGLIGAINARFADLGGRLECRSRVERILVDGGRVTGVRLSDGRTEPAEIVVSASDGRETIYKMLEGKNVHDEIERRYRDWRACRPLVGISIGTSLALDATPPLQTMLLDRPMSVGTVSAYSMVVRHYGPGQRSAPPGKSLLRTELESDWHFWYKLRALDRKMYEEEKSRIGREVVSRLEGLFPGITARAEMVEVSTPFTYWKYTMDNEGSCSGWAPTPEMLRSKPIRTLPGLSGLYMAGQWVVPGTGVPSRLFSGKHAIQMMCWDHGRTFKATAPIL